MIDPPKDRLPCLLAALASTLAIISSASALLIGPSVYKPMTPDEFLPGSLSQDTVSLLAASIILVLSVQRKELQLADWQLWLGLLGYLTYAYGIYAFGGVCNQFYLLYLGTLGLSFWSVVLFFQRAHLSRIQVAGDADPPRRLTACLFVFLSVLFLIMWLSILVPAMAERKMPDGNVIFVQDLVFVLPLMALTARLLWQADSLGDVLAVPLLIKAGTVGLSVLIGTIYGTIFFETPVNPTDLLVYGVLGFVPLALVPSYQRTLTCCVKKSD